MHMNAYGKKQHHFREKTTLHPTRGHHEEAHRIGNGARCTRGNAAWQRYLKEKHARLVVGAPRSPRLIFLLCSHQPLE
jgi:hypothetical protein